MPRIAFNSPNVFARSGYSPLPKTPRPNQLGALDPLDYYGMGPVVSTAIFNAPDPAPGILDRLSTTQKLALGVAVVAGAFWLMKGR